MTTARTAYPATRATTRGQRMVWGASSSLAWLLRVELPEPLFGPF